MDGRVIVVLLPARERHFCLLQSVHVGSGYKPAPCSIRSGDLPPGEKRPTCQTNHSPPSSAKIKNWWSHTSTSPYTSMTRRFIRSTATNSRFLINFLLALEVDLSLASSRTPCPIPSPARALHIFSTFLCVSTIAFVCSGIFLFSSPKVPSSLLLE